MNCNRLTTEDCIFYALGTLDDPEKAQLCAHLRSHCPTCTAGMSEAYDFLFMLAAVTDRTQPGIYPAPSPELRDRVLDVARAPLANQRTMANERPFAARTRTSQAAMSRTWLRVAAGILLTAGLADVSWYVGRSQIKKSFVESEVRLTQQTAAVRKLESENHALQALVIAAKNAPAVFPGRNAIVSVQDPYILRDLQRAQQTQAAMSHELTQERKRAGDLTKQLSQTNTLLAAATREKEFTKSVDASFEKDGGVHQLSSEISDYQAKVHELESEVGRYHALMDSQKKGLDRQGQLVSLLQSRSLTLVQLHGVEAGQAGSGVVLIADNSRLAFLPASLPALPAGRAYQLWLVRDRTPVSAGTFGPETANLQFGNQDLMSGLKTLLVTEEPAGGSLLPTGRKVLVGSPRS